ncbi:unnamed protein product, partial [marine sediment metagenome]
MNRSKGTYFLMLTLVLGQLAYAIVLQWVSLTKGTTGITGVNRPYLLNIANLGKNVSFYYFILVVFIICIILLYVLINSSFGVKLRGVRESESRMIMLGYNTSLIKWVAFMVSSFVSSIGGIFFVYFIGLMKQKKIPELLKGYVTLFDANVPIYNIFIFCFACFICLTLWLILQKTKIGMIIRAGVDNFEITSTLGINIQLVFTLVFTAAGFLAGIAGAIGGTYLMVAPGEDWRILTYALLVIIIGGMGSFGGTIVGSIIIG